MADDETVMVCAECLATNKSAAWPYFVVGVWENTVRFAIEPGIDGNELIITLAQMGRKIMYSPTLTADSVEWSKGWSPRGVTYVRGTLLCTMHVMEYGTVPDRRVQ